MSRSTELPVSAIEPHVGRKQINGEQTMARFPAGTLDRIKAVLRDGEPQSAFIRDVVLAEIERRERQKANPLSD